MLQVFCLDVANEDLDVALYAYCKHMFQVFLGVSYVCLQVFHLDVAYVCNGFQVFLQVFQTHVSSVSSVFFCMLQLLHLDISKVHSRVHYYRLTYHYRYFHAVAIEATALYFHRRLDR